ncbi:DUF3310 domain-containing protein [Mammaliicoccus sciuri]|uniref:DUF3310 domain-containing protein n=1 Tax=Mammaliicoccus sciuri TaxID=1296 RepID=UPI002DBA3AAE|nr:DUF3310 domain-containing protein [Mammaliicoccus sciuri]MEB8129700.1 DUF3310 domain-containing protein [Mammaliicoccus sciuri]
MEISVGERIHVTRFCEENVDFYATLNNLNLELEIATLNNCTNKSYEDRGVLLPTDEDLGKDKIDYFTLATDEEDTEEPVIQRINDMYNDVPTHYKADIDVIEFCRQHFTDEEFKGAMKFNLIKYPTRLGRKDDVVKELDKIIDYAQRYKEVLENELTQ